MSSAATSKNYPVWRSRLRSQCRTIVMAVAGETGFSIIREFYIALSVEEEQLLRCIKSGADVRFSADPMIYWRGRERLLRVDFGSSIVVRRTAGIRRKSGVQHSQREPLAGAVETPLVARSIQVKLPSLRRSRHCRQPGNGNDRGASTPPAQHLARIVRASRAEIGLQQRELH